MKFQEVLNFLIQVLWIVKDIILSYLTPAKRLESSGKAVLVTGASPCVVPPLSLPACHLPLPIRLLTSFLGVMLLGAASGLGQTICEQLLAQGCIVYAADRSLELLEVAWAPFDKSTRCGGNARIEFLVVDVTSAQQVEAAAKTIDQSGTGLFAVVNAAGISIAPGYPMDRIQGVVEVNVDQWIQPVMDVNLLGTMRVNAAVFPLLHLSKGCIINIASILGHSALAGTGAYAISKKAIAAYSDTMRRELAPYGVRVSCLAPGFVRTRMTIPVFHPQAVLAPRDYEHTVLQKGRGDEGQFQMIAGTWEQLPDPADVAKVALNHIFSSYVPPHIIIDNWKPKLFYTLLDFIPTQWADVILDKLRNRNIASYKVYGPKS